MDVCRGVSTEKLQLPWRPKVLLNYLSNQLYYIRILRSTYAVSIV